MLFYDKNVFVGSFHVVLFPGVLLKAFHVGLHLIHFPFAFGDSLFVGVYFSGQFPYFQVILQVTGDAVVIHEGEPCAADAQDDEVLVRKYLLGVVGDLFEYGFDYHRLFFLQIYGFVSSFKNFISCFFCLEISDVVFVAVCSFMFLFCWLV